MNKKAIIGIGAVALVLVLGLTMRGGQNDSSGSDLPTPSGAKNVISTGENAINYQTSMTVEEVEEFYRSALTAEGLVEREGLTVKSDTTLSFVFDGHASEMPLVVQAVKLEDGTNVNVRLENL